MSNEETVDSLKKRLLKQQEAYAQDLKRLKRAERVLVAALRVADDCLSLELYPSEGNVRKQIAEAI